MIIIIKNIKFTRNSVVNVWKKIPKDIARLWIQYWISPTLYLLNSEYDKYKNSLKKFRYPFFIK